GSSGGAGVDAEAEVGAGLAATLSGAASARGLAARAVHQPAAKLTTVPALSTSRARRNAIKDLRYGASQRGRASRGKPVGGSGRRCRWEYRRWSNPDSNNISGDPNPQRKS